MVNLVGGKWRAQSAERVAGVFETYHRRWGVDAVELVDNNFFVDERRVADFCDRIKHLQMAWWGEGRSDTMPWVGRSLQSRIRHFERVLNAYYPTSTMTRLTPAKRALLRAASAWRSHLKTYAWPLELDVIHRVMRDQRPETSGF